MKNKVYSTDFGLNSNAVKTIAILIMTFDHFCKIILCWITNDVVYKIGQLAFPLFAFLLVQGFLHTKNVYKYFFSLLLFAFISEIIFDLAFYDNLVYFRHQNVFFTLSLGLLILIILEKIKFKFNDDFLVCFFVQLSFCCLLLPFCSVLNLDHGLRGLLLILFFYIFKNYRLISLFFFLFIYFIFNSLNIYLLFSCVIILLYNGKRNNKNSKYLFYIYYPLHLIIFYIIKKLIIFLL